MADLKHLPRWASVSGHYSDFSRTEGPGQALSSGPVGVGLSPIPGQFFDDLHTKELVGYHSGRHLARTQGQEQAEGTDPEARPAHIQPCAAGWIQSEGSCAQPGVTTRGVKARRPQTQHQI